ncbi:MAG: prepilin-type N-terminal cleavage/methylation domain-containing protein [Rhodocyclaceae bacterium]
MTGKQAGFTLVEIAIVLVIIGLLLGGVLKGQELINSAKVKNFANDFRTIPLFIYGYQDKFRALPGDDPNVANHVTGGTLATTGGTPGNGVIEGNWNSTTHTEESVLFWQHVRLANLAAGPTDFADDTKAAASVPTNADGGRIGIESISSHYIQNADGATFLGGTYLVCSGGIQGKFAKQLDTTMDDGKTDAGSMRVVATGHTRGNQALANAAVDDGTNYSVCLSF